MSTASIDTVITDAGFDLLRAAPGHKLVYTRAVCGSGHVEKTQLATLTEISDYVMDLSIVEFGPSESAATLRLQLDNSKAPKEFQLYQIGVLAKLLDGEEELVGETLVQVMQYEKPDIVRAVPHVSEFVVNVLMGQAETVEGTIDMAAYVSIRQFSSRTVNGKPLSADVTITGEDIKVSVSDQTTVEAALSNKAESTYEVLTATNLLEWAKQQARSGAFNVNPAVTTSGLPVENWFAGFLEVITPTYTFRITITSANTGITYTNTTYDGEWIGWKELPIASPSQEYDVPLELGISNLVESVYSKDKFGMVRVKISIQAERLSGMNIRIGTLPEGFRPTVSRVVVPGFLRNDAIESEYQAHVCALSVYNDGSIFCDTYQYSGVVAQGQLWFPAN